MVTSRRLPVYTNKGQKEDDSFNAFHCKRLGAFKRPFKASKSYRDSMNSVILDSEFINKCKTVYTICYTTYIYIYIFAYILNL